MALLCQAFSRMVDRSPCEPMNKINSSSLKLLVSIPSWSREYSLNQYQRNGAAVQTNLTTWLLGFQKWLMRKIWKALQLWARVAKDFCSGSFWYKPECYSADNIEDSKDCVQYVSGNQEDPIRNWPRGNVRVWQRIWLHSAHVLKIWMESEFIKSELISLVERMSRDHTTLAVAWLLMGTVSQIHSERKEQKDELIHREHSPWRGKGSEHLHNCKQGRWWQNGWTYYRDWPN